MEYNKLRSNAEANALIYLNFLAKRYKLKGKFFANQTPNKNRYMFDFKFFQDYDISLNNKKLVKYLETQVKNNNLSWDFKKAFDVIKSYNFTFECDIVYIVNGKVKAIIEIHGPQHREMSHFLNTNYESFIATNISDYIKEDYCKSHKIPFFNTFVTSDNSIQTSELKNMISQLS